MIFLANPYNHLLSLRDGYNKVVTRHGNFSLDMAVSVTETKGMNNTATEHPLKTYRQAKGLSQEAFGALLGHKKAAVCKWESGVAPKPMTAIAIEEKTNGAVPRHILRPDLWEAPDEKGASR
jgi:DNA-binding transcriptional regulator YiaG